MFQFARRCNERQMLRVGVHLKAILDSSINEYRRLVNANAIDCQWRENGMLYVLHSQTGMKKFGETADILSEHFGVHARRLDGGELPEFDRALRDDLAGGFFLRG